MNQKLSRCLKRIDKYQKLNCTDSFEEEKRNHKIKEIKDEFYSIFEDFYLNQYKKDMKIPYSLRSEKDAPWFDMRDL